MAGDLEPEAGPGGFDARSSVDRYAGVRWALVLHADGDAGIAVYVSRLDRLFACAHQQPALPVEEPDWRERRRTILADGAEHRHTPASQEALPFFAAVSLGHGGVNV